MAENRDDRIKKTLSSLISKVQGETAELQLASQEKEENQIPEDTREKGYFLIVYYDGKKQKRCTMVSEWEWIESENGSPMDCHGFFYCRGKKYRVMGLSKEDFDKAVSFEGVCLDFSGYQVVAENNKRDPYIRNTKDIPLPDQDVYKAGGTEPVTHSAEWIIFPEGVTLKVTDSTRGEKLSEKVYAAMQKREKFKLITIFEDYANPGKTYTNYKINGRTFKALLKAAETSGVIDIQKMDKTYAFNEYLDAAFDSPLQEYRKAKFAAQEAGTSAGKSSKSSSAGKSSVKAPTSAGKSSAEVTKQTATEDFKAKEPEKPVSSAQDLSATAATAGAGVGVAAAAAAVAATGAATVTVTAASVSATSSMNLEDTQELVEKLIRDTSEEPAEVSEEKTENEPAQEFEEKESSAVADSFGKTEPEAEAAEETAEAAQEPETEETSSAETSNDYEEETAETAEESEAVPAEAEEAPEAESEAEAEAETEVPEPQAQTEEKSTFFSIDSTEELLQKPAPLEEGLTGKTVTVRYVMETSELNASMMPEALKPAEMRENLSPEEIARREAEAEEKRQELLQKKQQEAAMAELIAQKLAAATVEKTPEQKAAEAEAERRAAEAEAQRKAEEEAAAARAAARAAKRLEEAEARKAAEEAQKREATAALTAAALAAATGREGGDPLEMIQPGAAGVDDSTARLEGISDRLAKAVEQLTKLAELGEIEPILQEVDGGLDVLNSGAVKFKFLNEKGVRQTAYLDRIYYDYDGDCTYFVTTDGLQYYNPRVKKDEYRAIEFEMMDGAKEVNICKQGITSIYVPETYEEKKKQFMRRNNIQDPLS